MDCFIFFYAATARVGSGSGGGVGSGSLCLRQPFVAAASSTARADGTE